MDPLLIAAHLAIHDCQWGCLQLVVLCSAIETNGWCRMRWKVAASSSTFWQCTPLLVFFLSVLAVEDGVCILVSFITVGRKLKQWGLACRSPGYAPVPPYYCPTGSSVNVHPDGERASNEQSPQHQLANMPFAQYPQCGFLPFQYPGANNLSIPNAQLEAHKILLQQQIEVLKFLCLIGNIFYMPLLYIWYCSVKEQVNSNAQINSTCVELEVWSFLQFYSPMFV